MLLKVWIEYEVVSNFPTVGSGHYIRWREKSTKIGDYFGQWRSATPDIIVQPGCVVGP
jgi:hypothetical protein